ncbi:unnamed protein product [Peniophora sp. CBMAI 1063]|nr:unnamed protein product [Peniophora sp. CBMAI 1063]
MLPRTPLLLSIHYVLVLDAPHFLSCPPPTSDTPGTMASRSSNVFGPRVQAGRPLGREILLRVDVEGANGLPLKAGSQYPNTRLLCQLRFEALSDGGEYTLDTSSAYEGHGSLQGTVQWNETLYIRCLELSYINVNMSFGSKNYMAASKKMCMPVINFVSATQIPLVAIGYPNHGPCNLFLSVTRVVPEGEEEDSDLSASCAQARHDQGHIGPTLPAGVWNTAFSQMSLLLDTICRWQWKPRSPRPPRFRFGPWAHGQLYSAYRDRYSGMEGNDQLEKDLGSVFACIQEFMNVIRQPVARARESSKDRYIELTMNAVYGAVSHICEPSTKYWQSYHETYVAESAKLAWIIVTPDPPATSAGTSTTIAKDALLLVLEAIVQSSDAFPPLKSAASGLLFFATCADTACGNKKQIRDIYKRIHGLAASLKRGTKTGSRITPEHQEAIEVLAAYVLREVHRKD